MKIKCKNIIRTAVVAAIIMCCVTATPVYASISMDKINVAPSTSQTDTSASDGEDGTVVSGEDAGDATTSEYDDADETASNDSESNITDDAASVDSQDGDTASDETVSNEDGQTETGELDSEDSVDAGSGEDEGTTDVVSSVPKTSVWPEGPDVEAESAIVMDAESGLVLYEKNADAQQYPASITKIMTTLLALENCSLDETVTFSADAVYKNEGETSHIARDLGEEMTLEDTLYAVMLESANECAWAVGEHVGGGDIDTFVDMMNARAAQLGCTNTHFANPNGLHDDNHYTSARDMALISQEAIKNPMFRKIIGTTQYTIPPTNKHSDPTYLNNHHKMLNSYKGSEYLYEYCIGGKTGYTEAAHNTLVTYAEKDGMLLICVVMKTWSPYDDTIELFDYCFDNFAYYNISANETRLGNGSEFAELDTDASVILPVGANFNDTEVTLSYENASDTVMGTLIYSYGGREVGSMDILVREIETDSFVFDETYQSDEEDPSVSKADEFFNKAYSLLVKMKFSEWPLWVKLVAFALAAAVVALVIVLVASRGKRRARRQQREYRIIKMDRTRNKFW